MSYSLIAVIEIIFGHLCDGFIPLSFPVALSLSLCPSLIVKPMSEPPSYSLCSPSFIFLPLCRQSSYHEAYFEIRGDDDSFP